jgi:hypothetical protein
VRYDDRLLTVLSQPAGDRHDAAVRWRQLVDLIARAGPNGASPTVVRAIDEIQREAPNVDDDLRAAAARAVAALPLPLSLLEYFASDRLAVCAPVLAAATLDSGQWRALLAVADAETSRFIETLHPEVRTNASTELTEILVEPQPEDAPLELTQILDEAPAQDSPPAVSGPSLHDVVERIERRRRSRAAQPQRPGVNGEGALRDSSALFRWECGPSGEIAWVEGAARGPLIGRSIARPQESVGDRVDQDVVRAFAMRAPFRDAGLTVAGDGSVAGEWKISGVPAFEPADGRFAGYRGIALREAPSAPSFIESLDILSDPDSLRELVHEIKTPLNAIIGFAEIIDGQYLGPADRKYRQRAADIVAQARLLLTAIDDLDFAAKSHSPDGGEQPRTNLGQLVERLAPLLRETAGARGVEIDCSRTIGELAALVEPELADRLIYRMCIALIERAATGERLRLSVEGSGDRCRVSFSRPASLNGLSDEELFGSRGAQSTGDLSLRLVRGLARIAGADLVTWPGAVVLVFARA